MVKFGVEKNIMYCNTIIKYGKREGMICGRKNCKIRGHSNLFDYVYNLTNEPIFLSFKEVCKIVRFDNDAIIKIFEFGNSEYDEELKSEYFINLRYFLSFINSSPKIQKIALISILYTLLDLEGFCKFRFLNNINNTCNETLKINIELLKNSDYEYFEYNFDFY